MHSGDLSHSEPILSARNLLVPAKQQIPRAILPRFGMTILNRHLQLRHYL
jgi:hypothetical protein